MIFGIIMLVLVAAVAFYHYIQGFFSAMVSCVLVILAALIAVAYHEPLAEELLSQHLPTYAHPVVLVALFALAYVFMRLATDKLIPGNVRFHVLVDKIGAGVCGVVAGIFSVGVLAIAAQLLPFGPSIGGYSRFALKDRTADAVKLPKYQQLQTLQVFNELDRDNLDSAQASGMFPLAFDGMVLGLTSYLSDGGALAGDRAFSAVHPDYATELFANRLGQPFHGAEVLYGGQGMGLSTGEIYTSKWVLNAPEDIEMKQIRGDRTPSVPATDGQTPVVIRASIQGIKSPMMTMSAVRLVVKGKDYYPIGSYQRGEQLMLIRPDDPVVVDSGKTVDYVFLIDTDALVHKEGSNALTLPPGTFMEAKRSSRADLSNKEIVDNVPAGGERIGVATKAKQ